MTATNTQDRSFRRRAVCVAAAAATLALTTTIASADEPGVSLSDAWIRSIMASRPAGGYFTLTNDGDKPRTLVSASSPACGMVMLHRSMHEGGVDKMDMVESVDIPPHQSISFAPGGYHLMCTKPTDAVKPGKSIPMTLTFEDGGSLTADFPVKNAAGK